MYDKMNGIGAHEVIIETPDHNVDAGGHAGAADRGIPLGLSRARHRSEEGPPLPLYRHVQELRRSGRRVARASALAVDRAARRSGSVKEEVDGARHFYEQKERCIFCDIIRQERAAGVRLVSETDRFAVIEPYAPRFPFETWILPERTTRISKTPTRPRCRTWRGFCAPPCARWKRFWSGRPTISSSTARRCRNPRSTIITGTSRSFRSLTKVAGFEWGTGFYINPTPPEESAKFLREAGLG